jgi:DNA-binding LytR/AlgR family response regulator
MLKIAIVEDEELYTQKLKEYLSRYTEEKKTPFNIRTYSNAIDFLREYTSDYDIVFLDIKMPYLDGMTAAHKLREMDGEVAIVFTTSLTQYAIEGYSVNAVDYLVKPFLYEVFALKFSRAIKRVQERDGDYIIIKEENGMVRLNVADLRYVESNGHRCVYHLGDGKTFSRYASLRQAASELKDFHFSYCNSCYLVNLEFVKSVADNSATVDREVLQISQSKKKSFVQDWKSFGEMV